MFSGKASEAGKYWAEKMRRQFVCLRGKSYKLSPRRLQQHFLWWKQKSRWSEITESGGRDLIHSHRCFQLDYITDRLWLSGYHRSTDVTGNISKCRNLKHWASFGRCAWPRCFNSTVPALWARAWSTQEGDQFSGLVPSPARVGWISGNGRFAECLSNRQPVPIFLSLVLA